MIATGSTRNGQVTQSVQGRHGGLPLREAAGRLYGYLLKNHWNGQALEGPDVGVRFNARIWRFLKSYLRFVSWSDSIIYFQAQGYWVTNNWIMADLKNSEQSKDIALACSKYVLAAQRPEGYWEYPNPEWKGRIATVEGCYASIVLLESYERVRDEAMLEGAKKWYRYMLDGVGFQGSDGLLAINYFANKQGGMVPNNSTLALKTMAKLAHAANDNQYLEKCAGMVAWLNKVQLETGELPYSVGHAGKANRPHFLCYQYNAFEFLDLVQYYRLTGDRAIWPVLEKLAAYLSKGVTMSGSAAYDCEHERPEVLYYGAAVAAALSQATELGVSDYRALADRGYKWVLSQQRADGGFKFFSRGNYGVLADRRSYPRNLAMVLYHLLLEAGVGDDAERLVHSQEVGNA